MDTETVENFVTGDSGIYRFELQKSLDELDLSPIQLAKQMSALGDYRSIKVISRSVQRMLSGENRVSGEMLVITKLLLREFRKLIEDYGNLEWTTLPNGSETTTADGFRITLQPQTRGRWHVNLVHLKTGYSHPWPSWQNSLEAAKRKALFCLVDASDVVRGLAEDRE